MPFLDIIEVSAAYDDRLVLDGISLALEKADIVSLIGTSGSGKSTLLRVLMGLLMPRSGRILFDGVAVDYRQRQAVKAVRDRCAIVFQQYNLFQNMNVLRNVTIAPIKIKGRPRREAEDDAVALLEKVGLKDKLRAYPDELSGGQQQRVAIARALALKPQVLLLDEVTSALDPELVNEVLDTVRVLAAEGMTMLIVSHEMAFVREVSKKVVFIDEGRTVEVGAPARIFDDPQQARTREFVGKILRH